MMLLRLRRRPTIRPARKGRGQHATREACGEDEGFGPATHHPPGWRLEAL